MSFQHIQLAHGSGGAEMEELIDLIRRYLPKPASWRNYDGDSANIRFPANAQLVFTTDSFVVDPLFFAGGDIGKIAICGTINDLAVVGAKPLGISLALILEEGLAVVDLEKILSSMAKISQQTKIPIVTGDTKVVEKGKIDKIMINTSGVGAARKVISDNGLRVGDKILVSGDLGAHGATILAHRFKYKSRLKSDCQPLARQMLAVASWAHAAKDPTRGGLAMVTNEMAVKSKVQIIIDEKNIPIAPGAIALTKMLGIDLYALPSEGRFVVGVAAAEALKVIKILQKFNKKAAIIGSVIKIPTKGPFKTPVLLKTKYGLRPLRVPRGRLIPRIC